MLLSWQHHNDIPLPFSLPHLIWKRERQEKKGKEEEVREYDRRKKEEERGTTFIYL